MGNKLNLFVIFVAIFTFSHGASRFRRIFQSKGRSLEQYRHMKTLDLNVGKLIIDNDAGADDAGGILAVLGEEKINPDLKVIAMTCVNGNTNINNVVVNVLKTLQTAGRLDIPVYRGASNSVIWTPPSDNYFGNDGFGDFDYPNPPDPNQLLQKEHAVNALVRMVTENPGEITILCLGPLTNIALAIRMDSTFLTKVKQLVVMGGSVEGVGNVLPGIEFNFYVDPEAAHIVLNSTDTSSGKIQPIILLPFESVIDRNLVTQDWRKNVLGILQSPEIILFNNAEHYQLQANVTNWGCADCLAASVTIDSSIIQESESYYAYVAEDGILSSGAAFVDYTGSKDMSPNVVIVRNIDVEQYKKILLTNIGGVSPNKFGRKLIH